MKKIIIQGLIDGLNFDMDMRVYHRGGELPYIEIRQSQSTSDKEN